MYTYHKLTLAFALAPFFSFAQSYQAFGPMYQSTGISQNPNDFSALSHNPSLAPKRTFVGAWVQNRFLHKDFNFFTINAGWKSWLISFSESGNKHFNDYRFSIGTVKDLAPNLKMGISTSSHYFVTTSREIKNELFFGPSLGFNYNLESMELALLLRNFVHNAYTVNTIPSYLSLRLLIRDSQSLYYQSELFAHQQNFGLALSLSYLPKQNLQIFIGGRSFPKSLNFGFCSTLGNISILVSSSLLFNLPPSAGVGAFLFWEDMR
ncbi:hypothetical protein [Luteibaculum oceani]|uniref:Type IX secretion system membrane protein PorP/SprF n=1 Tax=Luteibaculum oceani TaxID=1294296 RepID=A0A5C6UY69_9FLAO|nr:hypothetical protein [Luteibaculum oceani]TXC78443.1 hypothetical protein FRX97_08920 [Luteibaculum oceani]